MSTFRITTAEMNEGCDFTRIKVLNNGITVNRLPLYIYFRIQIKRKIWHYKEAKPLRLAIPNKEIYSPKNELMLLGGQVKFKKTSF